MDFYSTGEAAKKIGISLITLKRYIAAKKIPLPPRRVGGIRVRLWSEEDIRNVRQLLPKIANGRKTRYQKLREKQKAQTKSPVPRKTKKNK
jgi:predicted site-specific integrase-resolvase